MKNETNLTRDKITELTKLSEFDYERIFRMYQEDGYYIYNIIKQIHLPVNIDDNVTKNIIITGKMSWTQLSFEIYGTIRLWWLICSVNKILNPVILPKTGTALKVIKPEFVSTILNSINDQV